MSDVLTWARRWARRSDASDHELLELPRHATLEDVRRAYHKLARFAHPDLHRATRSTQELEEITQTFARASNAYAVLTARLRKAAVAAKASADRAPQAPHAPRREDGPGTAPRPTGSRPASPASPPARATASPPPAPTRSTGAPGPSSGTPARATASPEPARADSPSSAPGGTPAPLPIGPSNAMSPKALVHYRRAELSMRRGAVAEARLHLKLAAATDPQSAFLRKVMADLASGS